MCRKVLLKAFQGSTGPITQLLGFLFSTAAVADSLHAACCMQHGQNQRWDNNTLTLHNNLGNLLPSTVSSTEILEARPANYARYQSHHCLAKSLQIAVATSLCLKTTHLSKKAWQLSCSQSSSIPPPRNFTPTGEETTLYKCLAEYAKSKNLFFQSAIAQSMYKPSTLPQYILTL